jgi:hypothetical protein
MSSAIRHMHYKPELEELSIWFAPDGRRYKYFGVPQRIYLALRDSPSRGQYFNRAIKGRFECRLADVPGKLGRRREALRSVS